MQVMGPAASDWARAQKRTPPTPEEMFDPRLNVRIGSWYLSRAQRDWAQVSQPEAMVLAQYNAGPSVARRWAKAAQESGRSFTDCITYPSTRLYVDHILRRYRHGG
jgi:soluble lytic murein transglycosylase